MKIRNGFVSNSSSSSFIVFGRRGIKFDDIDIKDKTCTYYMEGEGCDAADFFPLTPEIYKLIEKNYRRFNFDKVSFWKTYSVLDGESTNLFTKEQIKELAKNINETVNITSLNVDQHSCYEIEEFKERYIDHENT